MFGKFLSGGASSKKNRTVVTLDKLPQPIMVQIMTHIPLSTLPALARTSQHFRNVAADQEYYRILLCKMGFEKEVEDYVKYLRSRSSSNNLATKSAAATPLSPEPSASSSPSPSSEIAAASKAAPPRVAGKTEQDVLDAQVYTPPKALGNLSLDADMQVNWKSAFKCYYKYLMPLYLEFRGRKAANYLTAADPLAAAITLRDVRRFSNVKHVLDHEKVNMSLETTIEYFESTFLTQFDQAYDDQNIPELKRVARIVFALNGGNSCIQLYICKNPIFFDTAYSPVHLFSGFRAGATGFAEELGGPPIEQLIDYLYEFVAKQNVIIDQVFETPHDVVCKMLERLFEENISEYVSSLCEQARAISLIVYLQTVVAIYAKLRLLAKRLHTDLTPLSLSEDRVSQFINSIFGMYIQNYLAEEEEYLSEAIPNILKQHDLQERELLNPGSTTAEAPSPNLKAEKQGILKKMSNMLKLPVSITRSDSDRDSINSQSSMSSMTVSMTDTSSSTNGRKPKVRSRQLSSSSPLPAFMPRMSEQATDHLLSPILCGRLLKLNKEAVHRCVIISPRESLKKSVEKIFVLFLKSLVSFHIQPAFQVAIDRLMTAAQASTDDIEGSMAQLKQFCSLVQTADSVQQIIHVYYKDEICPHIDEKDIFADAVTQKKSFERMLDDSVAAGMEKGVEILIRHVQHLLSVEQQPTDWNPEKSQSRDIKPTKACLKVIEVLESNNKQVAQVVDRHTHEIFAGEVGSRFFTDLNKYYEWCNQLQSSEVKSMYEVLKELGNIYVVDGDGLKQLVHDVNRFQGIFRVEELYEFLQARSDYRKISFLVESDLKCIIS